MNGLDGIESERGEGAGGGSGSDSWLPLVVLPRSAGRGADQHLPRLRASCERYLPQFGSVLLRGFQIGEPADFRRLISSLAEPSAELDFADTSQGLSACEACCDGSSEPRHEPLLHSARTYTRRAPTRLWFWCASTPAAGDALALADCRDVQRRVPESIRQRWSERGLLYVREFAPLPQPADAEGETESTAWVASWSRAFGTSERSEVESSCEQNGFGFTWGSGGSLRIWRACPPILTHPASSERTWFNQAHLFAMPAPGPCEPSLASWRVFHADGAPLDAAETAEVRAAFAAARTRLSWEAQDVLVIDNLLTAHAVSRAVSTLGMAGQYAPDAARLGAGRRVPG